MRIPATMGLEGKSPDYWEEATTYLSHSDEILAEIIEEILSTPNLQGKCILDVGKVHSWPTNLQRLGRISMGKIGKMLSAIWTRKVFWK